MCKLIIFIHQSLKSFVQVGYVTIKVCRVQQFICVLYTECWVILCEYRSFCVKGECIFTLKSYFRYILYFAFLGNFLC